MMDLAFQSVAERAIKRWVTDKLDDLKSAIDFGAKGDDAFDNKDAVDAARNYCFITGGKVKWPHGIYRSSVGWTLDTRGGGFVGEGRGSAYFSQPSGPAGAACGTVFRLTTATGDTLTIARTSRNAVVRDIGFWPVPFKTGGFEIHDQGTGTEIAGVAFAFCYGGLRFGAGCNGATASGVRGMGCFGPDAVLFQGSSPAIADWAQGIALTDYEYYTPWPIIDPPNAQTSGAWIASTAYALGHTTILPSGWIVQAVQAGTSGASAPAIPSFPFAAAPMDAAYWITDGTAKWRLCEHQYLCAIRFNSNVVSVNVGASKLLSARIGVLYQNTLGGLAPQAITIENTLIDHTITDCAQINAGYDLTFLNVRFHLSALGRGATITGGVTGKVDFIGGRVWGCALDGIGLSGAAGAHVKINGTETIGNGVAAANTYSGIVVPAGTKDFDILGVTSGPAPIGGGTQKYGIDIGAGCDNYIVSACRALGNGIGGINNVPGVAATRQLVGCI